MQRREALAARREYGAARGAAAGRAAGHLKGSLQPPLELLHLPGLLLRWVCNPARAHARCGGPCGAAVLIGRVGLEVDVGGVASGSWVSGGGGGGAVRRGGRRAIKGCRVGLWHVASRSVMDAADFSALQSGRITRGAGGDRRDWIRLMRNG